MKHEPTSRDSIRVILADDYAVVRAGLRAVLGAAPDIVIVGEASTGRDAVALAQQLLPDVVLMDLDMPDGDGATALEQMVALKLRSRVLILTMHNEVERRDLLMRAGAAGYLVKDVADRELVAAVRHVALGGVYPTDDRATIQ